MINLIILPGDSYKRKLVTPFISFLKRYDINPIFVQLLENERDCTYEDLETDNYMRYIDSKIPSRWRTFTIYSISKGCHWARVYASKYPNRVEKLIMVEPTTFNPKLMREYEKSRGNHFIEDFYRIDSHFSNINPTLKSLDVLVSDKHKYIPKVKTVIVYTRKNNEGIPYSLDVLRMKNEFVRYLKRNGVKLEVFNIDSHHCVDLYSRNFPFLKSLILE